MAYIGTIGTATATSTTASVPVTTTSAVSVGTTLVGTLALEAGSGALPTLTVSDTHGNTYTVDKQIINATNISVSVFSCRVTTAINSGDTITLSASNGTRIRWAITIQAYDDILNPRIDQTASAIGTTASPNAGTTATTTNANELIYAGFGWTAGSNQTFTAGSGYTASTQVNASPGSANRSGISEWKYVTLTGTQNPTGTLSASSSWAGATVTYKSAAANQNPTANAGPDQTVNVSNSVQLDGSGSSDPDGTIASYSWTQISGTTVTLSSSSVAMPTFTAPSSAGTLVFGLTVTDNSGATSTQDQVTITVQNRVGYVGEAAAGASNTSGTSYQLTFSKSVPIGHTLLIGVTVDDPAGTGAPTVGATDSKGNTYTNRSQGYRTSTASVAIISCYVTSTLSTSDTLTITTSDTHGRWAVSVCEFDNIHQTGFDVSANNNAAATTSLTTGATATTANQVEVVFASFGFTLPSAITFSAGTHYAQAGSQQNTAAASSNRAVANEYRIYTAATAHTATGTLSASASYAAAIATFAADVISDVVPVADAGFNQTVAAYQTVTLDGTRSTDEDGNVAGYSWTQTAGTTVTLSNSTVAQPTFTAPGTLSGDTLTFSLVVTDNLGTSSTNSATVTVTVNPAENYVAHGGVWTAMQELAANSGTWS